jgi:hypothetical protein
MKPKYNTINKQLDAMSDKLIARIQELATKVVKKNQLHFHVTGFCMAMGTATFHIIGTETDPAFPGEEFVFDTYLDAYELLQYKQVKGRTELKELEYIFDEYNDMFHLTGSPLRVDMINEEIFVKTDW